LIVIGPNGERFSGTDLVGAVVVGDDAGESQGFRIDGVSVDPKDPEIYLYTLSTRDAVTAEWEPYCTPDERGVAAAVFLSGSWNSQGTHLHDDRFSVACTSGVIGKCVRLGYKPWKMAEDGRSMWEYHQACTRAVRADYCGNGEGQTRPVRIEIIDRRDPWEQPRSGLVFEAAWTPDGATCVAKARLSQPLQEIVAKCPHRLTGRVGDISSCNMASEFAREDVLLVNKSGP
jgi:hypothetical protein